MDQDCIKLTSYFTERQAGGRFTATAVDNQVGAGEVAASIILRGRNGSGNGQPVHASRLLRSVKGLPAMAVAIGSRPRIEALLDQAIKLSSRGLVTMGAARLLSEVIDPVGLWDSPGESTKLTVYFNRQDRIYQVPAYEVICDLLHRRGIPGATVLAGIDGTFASRHARAPMIVTAVGPGQQLGLILPELGGLLRHPLITLEQVRVCKRNGQLISHPQVVAGADADGRPLWLKVSVHACDSPRHDTQSLHRAIRRRLHDTGVGSVITLRGVWGFHGDHAPHSARHVPAVTVAMDAPERMAAAISVIDELTAKRGLVTSETVSAVARLARALIAGVRRCPHATGA